MTRSRRLMGLAAGAASVLVSMTLLIVSSTSAATLRVGIVSCEGCVGIEKIKLILSTAPEITCSVVDAGDLRYRGTLDSFDVIVFPGGRRTVQSAALGIEGRDNVRKFVAEGGGYLGICAGAFLALDERESLGILPARLLKPEILRAEGWGAVSGTMALNGEVELQVENSASDVLENVPTHFLATFAGGPLFASEVPPDRSGLRILARFKARRGVHVLQERQMLNSPAVLFGRFGRGKVIVMSPHPELSSGAETLLVAAIRATASR